jgi:DNA-binding transcriptional LysR family regulator
MIYIAPIRSNIQNDEVNLEHLSYFAEAARQQHVTNAARSLKISPSAVSHAVAKLEEELGHRLFEREGKGIVLTLRGRRFAERVEGILRSLRLLQEELEGDDAGWSTHYRIAATHGLADRLLTPAWVDVSAGRDSLRADLSTMRTSDILRAIAMSELDYAIGYSPLNHPDVETEVLVRGRLVVAVRPGHPILERSAKKRPAALQAYPHASVRAYFGTASCEDHPLLAKWKAVGRTPFYFDSYDIAIRYVERTDAWAIVPEWTLRIAAKLETGLETALPLGEARSSTIAAMWPKSRRLSAPLLALHERLKATLAGLHVQ